MITVGSDLNKCEFFMFQSKNGLLLDVLHTQAFRAVGAQSMNSPHLCQVIAFDLSLMNYECVYIAVFISSTVNS